MKNRNVAVIGVTSLLFLFQVPVVFGAVSAPLVSKQGYGLGAQLQQGGEAVVGSWDKVHFNFTFMYEGDTSTLKAFRLYEKKPNTSTFSELIEFNNLLDVTSSHSAVSGTWSLSRLNTTWIISKRNTSLLTTEPVPLYEPISIYPTGTYNYYVTAVDSYNFESAPSQTFNLQVLGPIQILDPAENTTVSLNPNLHWTVALGWPDNQVLYLINVHDGTKTTWSKTLINKTGELNYDGPALDPTKKYILNIQGRWTSDTLKPRETYFAGSYNVTFQVSATPPIPPPLPPTPPPVQPPPIACAEDTKLCPGGSYVSRIAPSCEFKTCPILLPPPKIMPPTPKPLHFPEKPIVQKIASTSLTTTSTTTSEKAEKKHEREEKQIKPLKENKEPSRDFFVSLWHRIFSFIFGA